MAAPGNSGSKADPQLIAQAVGRAIAIAMADGNKRLIQEIRTSSAPKVTVTSNDGVAASVSAATTSAVAAIGSTLFRALILPLLPLTVLAKVLTSVTSGFDVFIQSIGVLTAVLGTALTPVFMILAAGVLAASEYLIEKMIPAMEGFYAWIGKFTSKFTATLDLIEQIVNKILGRTNSTTPPTGSFMSSEKTSGGGETKSFGDMFRSGLRDALEQQRLTSMPRSQASGLVQASLNAQINALNGDPIQRRMLDAQNRSNELLQRLIDGSGSAMAR